MDKKFRLYVWPFYKSGGLAFAIAESLEKAAEWVMGSDGPINLKGWGPVQIFELDKPMAFSVMGRGEEDEI